MVDRIADPWGERTPVARGASWPARVDAFLESGVSDADVERWVQSACVLCSHGCGMDIAVKDERIVGVRGRAVDRVNRGRLGPKGLYGWQANNADDRLTSPLIRRDGDLVDADWDTAMSAIVDRSKTLLAEAGPLAFGFYTSGQLFLEEYYTQALVTKAGIGTPHTDGNTRLCTATADAALKETFGSDGDPASYVDLLACDTLFLVGHNVAETQTVMWARMLDRLHGPDRPALIVVDPRATIPAREADVHLPIRNGTNLALLNAILHELISNDWIDRGFIEKHTVGFGALRETALRHPPERAAEICGVPAADIREAARLIGASERLVSTALQGVYQSHQATAAACQVNNINLVRGMIGRPGCGVFQMNGQPTAQNTRETGADGDFPGLRNWANPAHVQELADLWNVDPITIPHWGPPTHCMQIFRYAETGAIRFLWVSATNPAVSLPELHRIRSILEQDRLFVVVQDAFLSETAAIADVVLPAALWGEKTGTFTNADRTVHLSERAVAPPGAARSDLDVWIEYARRMGFSDRDGSPLVPWTDAEGAFNHFARITRGRPADYSGLSYDKLRGGSGIQWPCTDEAPEGTERLYTNLVFNTDTDYTEDYGHDLVTGAAVEESEHRAMNPAGRAILRTADYQPPHEGPNDDYPLLLTTGRTLYHWHTRTKSGRVEQLRDAAPDVWIELSPPDAQRLEISEGDRVLIESARGRIAARARVSGTRQGVVFVPFHFGSSDEPAEDGDGSPRAANEMTITQWDPVSKQPILKVAAVRLTKLADGDGSPAPAPTTTASAPADRHATVPATVGGPAGEATSTVEAKAGGDDGGPAHSKAAP
jgi:ferredoxin-nitrate reductase